MSKEKYIEDLKEIKDIMSRSSRFISLSGLSGVSTGITAITGALLAYLTIFKEQDHLLVYDSVELSGENMLYLITITLTTFILAIVNAIFFTVRTTRKNNQTVWDTQTKRLIINLLIPLTTGGILCFMFLIKGFIGILPSLTLIFYGLALINASKYTFSEIRTLGMLQLFLGLLAFQFLSLSILIWAFGFGVLQIIYGLIIHVKYK